MRYQIPFNYTVNASIYIEAESLTDALYKVQSLAQTNNGTCPLIHGYSPVTKAEPDCASIKIDEELAEDLNPKRSYTVKLIRTQTVEIEVEAHSEQQAESLAITEAENGGFEEYSHMVEEEIICEEVELVD